MKNLKNNFFLLKRLYPGFFYFLLVFLGCQAFENHPLMDSQIVLFGLKDPLEVTSKNQRITFRVKVLGKDILNQGAGEQPVNKTTIRVFSISGAGQFFDSKKAKKNCPDDPERKMQGGYQFFSVDGEKESDVCVPFNLKTNEYGEAKFGITNITSLSAENKLFIIFSAGSVTTSYSTNLKFKTTED